MKMNLLIPICLFCLIQSIFGQVQQQQGMTRPDKQIEPNPKEEEVRKDEKEEPKMLMDSPIGDDQEQQQFGKGMGEEEGKMDEGERSNRAKRQWGYGYGDRWGGGWGRPWGGWGGGWGRPWGGWGGGWGRSWGGGYGYGGYWG